MIQRRQTIFMLLTAIISALLFFMPLASFEADGNVMKFTIFGIQNPIESIPLSTTYTWPLVVSAVLMTIVPIYTIFRFKKRELQVKLCRLVMLFNVVFIGLVFLYYKLDVAYFIGMALPLVNIVLEILAVRGIKKDIELLKSVDRLR